MNDLIVALIGITAAGTLFNKNIKENFGNLPNMTVKTDKMFEVKNKNGQVVDMMTVPPSYQAMVTPRPANIQYNSYVLGNLPDQSMLGIPQNQLTYGPVRESQVPSQNTCNQGVNAANFSKENWDDTIPENYEPISKSANVFEKEQLLADNGIVKSGNPSFNVETPDGPVSVTVYDRLMYSNTRSRLYGAGDPIRGDIGCIVPIKDQWFRPSVRPNIDLRAGAMTVMGGIDNDTPRELRALQASYSAGVSEQNSYAYSVNPSLAQKDIQVYGNVGAQSGISVTAFP